MAFKKLPNLLFIKIILLIFLVNFKIKSQEILENELNSDLTTISIDSKSNLNNQNKYLKIENIKEFFENTLNPETTENLNPETTKTLNSEFLKNLNPELSTTTLSSTEIINEILNELEAEPTTTQNINTILEELKITDEPIDLETTNIPNLEEKSKFKPKINKNELKKETTTPIQYLTELKTLAPISETNEVFLEENNEEDLTTISIINVNNTINNLLSTTEPQTTTTTTTRSRC